MVRKGPARSCRAWEKLAVSPTAKKVNRTSKCCPRNTTCLHKLNPVPNNPSRCCSDVDKACLQSAAYKQRFRARSHRRCGCRLQSAFAGILSSFPPSFGSFSYSLGLLNGYTNAAKVALFIPICHLFSTATYIRKIRHISIPKFRLHLNH